MIIGLLLGGILKGKELVENTRVTQTIRQIQGYDTAVIAFRTIYNALPGDMRNPSSRLPDCASSPCSVSGGGNNQFDAGEEVRFWLHLSKAGLITGGNMSGTVLETVAPSTPFGGCMYPSYIGSSYNVWSNIMYVTTCNPSNYSEALLTTGQSAQIDRKIDDNRPFEGDVQARESPPAGCIINTGSGYAYGEAAYKNQKCYFFRKMQL